MLTNPSYTLSYNESLFFKSGSGFRVLVIVESSLNLVVFSSGITLCSGSGNVSDMILLTVLLECL